MVAAWPFDDRLAAGTQIAASRLAVRLGAGATTALAITAILAMNGHDITGGTAAVAETLILIAATVPFVVWAHLTRDPNRSNPRH